MPNKEPTKEWETDFQSFLQDVIDAEKNWGYGDPEDVDNAKADIKDFVSQAIQEALKAREAELMKRIRDEVTYCPEAYGFEGRGTFHDCGKCIVCEANKEVRSSL